MEISKKSITIVFVVLFSILLFVMGLNVLKVGVYETNNQKLSIVFADASGDFGTNCHWEFNESTKTLTFSSSDGINEAVMHNYHADVGSSDPDFYSNAPWHNLEINSVIIEEKVINVGTYCFYNMSNIQNVIIGKDVKKIDGSAFSRCSSLKSVVFASYDVCSLTSIEEYSFTYTGLESISFPTSLVSIGFCSFSNCQSLENIKFSEGLQSIGYQAFGGCSNLSGQLIIPNTVTEICAGAFCYCNLSYIEIPNTVTKIDGMAFAGNLNLKTVIIGSGWVTSEEDDWDYIDSIFFACDNIVDIYLASSAQNYNLMESDEETLMQFYAVQSISSNNTYVLEQENNANKIYTTLVAGKHLVRKEAVDNGDVYVVTLNSDTALASSANNLLWTRKGNSGEDLKTAYKVVVNDGYYGLLPQGVNGEPISWKNGNSRIKSTTLVDLIDDVVLNGTYVTFPNTGVGVDIVLPSAIILTLSVAIVFVAFGGKKKKIIVK